MNFFNIEFKEDDSFFYSVSVISALQNKMINKEISDSLVESSYEEIIKRLYEFGYNSNTTDIDEIFQDAVKNLYAKLSEIVIPIENKKILDVLFLYNDFQNLKIGIKKLFSLHDELNFDIEYINDGTLSVDYLNEILKNKSLYQLPLELTGVASKALEMKSKGFASFYIDNFIDASYLRLVLEISRKYEDKFLEYYFINYTDLLNISTALRLKKIMPDMTDLERVFISKGTLSLSDFQFLYQTKIEDYIDFLSRKPYGEVIKEGVNSLLKTGSFLMFEKLKDNFLLSIAKKSKIIRNSVDSIFGYFFGKQNEIRNIHLILAGKKNNLDPNTIKERVRDYYV